MTKKESSSKHKISKSDTTPEDEARGREARARFLEKRCRHFEVGTGIMYQNRTGTILERVPCGITGPRILLRIRWEDGSVGIIKPHALNRR